LVDRIYARTFALASRANVDDAIEELLTLAQHNPHLLGHVRDRFEGLRSQRPTSEPITRALHLVTETWIRSIP